MLAWIDPATWVSFVGEASHNVLRHHLGGDPQATGRLGKVGYFYVLNNS